MRNGIFNGLDELETMKIDYADVQIIQDGVLDSLKELKVFTFEESSLRNIEISINGLTGAEPLRKLENVTFTYKLTESINRNSFTGLTNVKLLDLRYCQIEFIGENSFDSISESIEILDLSGNKLTTVPSDLFNAMLPKDDLKIHIYGNSWHCGCELQSLKLTIVQYEDNFYTSNSIECLTPAVCRSPNILIATCFEVCEIPSSTPRPTTTTTTTTTSPPNQNDYVNKQCYKQNESKSVDSVTVSIKRPRGAMMITENEYGKVNLKIDIENAQDNLLVIWFDELQNSADISDDDINCMSANGITPTSILDLKDNVLYSFCLMDTTSSTVSPLDCVPYMKRQYEIDSVWLYGSSKPLTISLIAIGSALNVLLGIAIGFWIFKYNPFSTRVSQLSNDTIKPKDLFPSKYDG